MSGAKKALVTGGSAGLGRAVCAHLLAEGWQVTSVDREPGTGHDGPDELRCDLSDREAVDALAPELARRGPFDLVVLNAGISATGRFEMIPADIHRRVLSVNAEAPLVLCAGLATAGALARGGTVIFVSSLAHQTGYPGASSYAASKGAVAVYARSIRKPFRDALGVNVACAFPGPLRTDHAARHAPEGSDASKRMLPETAARLILAGARRGRAVIFPGFGARLFATAGTLLPGPVTRLMRRIIFERLDREAF